ncbi:uncharacterized protein LOC113501423 [Trichoplusia ni]|uniref:Uncharacterized protein LOC113501423 n=1 Tax=Trichoplusia ni TaxID=7111 RepID=A0A7E5WD48_TRINI|nr:uncharacterized protein LOC113501423 [Trichoplusia ni]
MPVTRSQKDVPLRPPSRPLDAAAPTSGPEGATSATAPAKAPSSEATTSSGTTATEYTTTTEATMETATTAASEKSKAAKKANKKTPEEALGKGLPGSSATLKPMGVGRRARSTKTTSSSARRKELAAREELARLELEQAQAAARLARIRLELTQCEDEDSMEEDEDLEEERTAHVKNWIETSVLHETTKTADVYPGQRPAEDQKVKPEEEASAGGAFNGIQALTAALKEAFSSREGATGQPKYIHELPYFDGNSSEWMAFKVVYEDTAHMFSNVQNMARLRRALKGNAREAIRSLLYSEASAEEVMQALKRRFGRPDALILAELEKVKTLARISENPREICVFASQVNNSVAAIKGLKKPQYLHSPEIVKCIVEKLPTVLKFRWYDYTAATDDGEFSDLNLISRFLNQEADKCGAFAALEERNRKTIKHASHVTRDSQEREPRQAERKCPMCEGEHVLLECRKFQKSSVQDRWAAVKKSRVCFKCLQGRHRKEMCRKPPCKTCKRWHHHLLHAEAQEEASSSKDATEAAAVMAAVNTVSSTRAYLKMVPVEVYGTKGSKKILALMDEGSTVTLLDQKVAEEVGAHGRREELTIETVGGRLIQKKDSQLLDLAVKGVHQGAKKILRGVRTMEGLKLAPQFLEKGRIERCKHLTKLSDALYYEGERPQLLIGQDNWELIVSREVRKGKPGEPVASRTGLGWVLHGTDSGAIKRVQFINTCLTVSSPEEEMHRVIKDHFAIEALGVQPRRPSTDAEGQAIAILEKTCRRLEDGRFEAGLLWRNPEERMPDSYTSAKNRLANIEKKIDKDPQLKEEYGRQMEHLLDSGYAEEAPAQPEDTKKKWYLPHFAVVHPLKKKIRIVFDAAAKSGGKSLNDALLPGPDLLQSLFGVLLRFRQGPLAVAADIKEMFLQVRIRPEDRDSLRFLWRGDRRDESPKEYRMTSVIFGATSSPSTAIYVKNRNAADFQEEYPEAARAIELNHYMDDYLHSFHSEEDLRRVTAQVDFIHRKAGFELRGWASNQPELLHRVRTEMTEKVEVNLGEKEEKTLGLRWFTEKDSIGFRANLRNTPEEIARGFKVPTKREVTSAVMSTFDPLGLASPVLIQGKKLLQNIWRSGIGWDEEIADQDHETWKVYLEKMKLLQGLQIPRCLAPRSTEGELHTFTDASETAYAAAVYWRAQESDGTYLVNLVAAKVRVTPLKPVSVPRLELQAALLGSRLAHAVEEEMDLKASKKTFWTDSSIVLSWIKTDPRTFKTFVAHRLAEIEDLTKPQDWRWVPTAHNPADDATRDVPDNFDNKHRWYTGPDFLRQEEAHWPAARTFRKETTGEEKSTDVVATASVVSRTPKPERFSSWKRLQRATARVLQFIQLCRPIGRVNACKTDPTWRVIKKKAPGVGRRPTSSKEERRYIPLSPELLEQAEKLLLRESQERSFHEEIRHLQKGKQLEGNSKLKRLDVVLDEDLLRVKGRIDAIQGVSRNFIRPIVLDSKDLIGRLILEDYHRRFNHGNHATVMNEVRQRYWVLGLRSALKTVQHQCQWCRARRGKPGELPTGNLPVERLTHSCPPFTCTGVDYFGPLSVTVARHHEKRWGALFTCLTTRAVHIELVPSLSTDSMMMALRRFAARRGMPKTIYSDNGTNFVGANRELQEALQGMNKENLTSEAEKIDIQWKFIPPGAPNMGGAWERLVRSIKTALDATLHERHPREEVLLTLLLEAEHTVNSRPLTHLSENPEEEALTPNHFLLGRSCGTARLGHFGDNELVGRHTWKATQRLADHFWQRWLREYLPTLLPRKTRGGTSPTDLRVGDIVLIVDHTLPRDTWPRGRIVQVYPGPDGRTRIVDIGTRGGVLRRPSSRVVLLVPGESPSQEDGATHEGENVGD